MERQIKPKYYLDRGGEFVIKNYHLARPFSSFFPGIAGLWGIPVWVFYVNRGQAIASFGIKDKDHPIIEFQPANKAYQLTSLTGFRTFIKIPSARKNLFYDAFHNSASSSGFAIENQIRISSYELKLKEINRTLGLEVEVEYFTIPNDNFGALARKVILRNLSHKERGLELIDGLPQVIPYGVNNFFLKELSRTIEAWMDVENLKENIPFFRIKVDPADRPEVAHIKQGNFYLVFDDAGLCRPIVDPEAIFGRVSDFTYPENFLKRSVFNYPRFQLITSRTPCAFVYKKINLKPGGDFRLYSVAGNMDSLEKLRANSARITQREYFERKQLENKELICGLQEAGFTHSSSAVFDFYARQNFLDNVLRGGYPLSTKEGQLIQTYSRKHGDLERDYNRFYLEPAYFSQGNGNYRDCLQNRRNNVWFNPQVKDYDIRTFFNLLQSDGYNPLVLKPDLFLFHADTSKLEKFFSGESLAKVKKHLEKPFSPGELILFIEAEIFGGKEIFKLRQEFLDAVLADSTRMLNAEHGEGFWTDHWTYCLDLLESYLGVYPENLKQILLEDKEFAFFDNSEVVRPRAEKYVLKDGKVFQYHSVANNHHKSGMIKKRESLSHISRKQNGAGEIYKTSLITKMLVVIANKFGCLDPFGAGIEMEANKPNWFDSLNGLPGLLGSSTCETFELKRWIIFLREGLKKLALSEEYSISLSVELYDLLFGLSDACRQEKGDYVFWDKTHSLREDYLQKTLCGFKGEERQVKVKDLDALFGNFLDKIASGLQKAYDKSNGLYHSYFINEVVDYELLEGSSQKVIKPLKFKQIPLPLFLGGIVHYLRVIDNQGAAKRVFQAVRKSQLYDKKLKMYKVTAALKEAPAEIGRCRIFAPGWLENESIWLHMEYKYILELLKNGLYKEFFEDFKNALIPFQDAGRYGRSTLENSSFLVSSAFTDKRLHGAGFVARLSGSTAEFISIWLFMCAGRSPFYLDADKKLRLQFKPVLPGWIFSRKEENGFPKDTFAFKFLNKTLVVYHNPKRKDTFGLNPAEIKSIALTFQDKSTSTFSSSFLPSPIALDVRAGKVPRIDIHLA
jgi:hypothetical protein